MTDKIKPCPFCGKIERNVKHYLAAGEDIPAVSVITHRELKCPANGWHQLDTWNTRASQQPEITEAHKELLEAAFHALATIDEYNSKNGTHLCGKGLLRLAKAIAPYRTAMQEASNV